MGASPRLHSLRRRGLRRGIAVVLYHVFFDDAVPQRSFGIGHAKRNASGVDVFGFRFDAPESTASASSI